MSKKILSKGLIIVTIILIAAFQCYWINRLYKQEMVGLSRETDVLFRDVVYKLQLQRFKEDTVLFKKGAPDNLFAFDVITGIRQMINDTLHSISDKRHDSPRKRIMISLHTKKLANSLDVDSFTMATAPGDPYTMLRYTSGTKTINDSLPLRQIDSAYKVELRKNKIYVGYILRCISGRAVDSKPPVIKPGELKTNFTFAGLSKSYAYQAEFGSPFRYILGKLSVPLLVSFLLIAFTGASFVFLYRNLVAQQRLGAIKNEFISNITHELKTPIATVNVAIEALRNFNALQDPVKTKEYLDISAAELQRLSLLVDKVLRLSMFENKQVELKIEKFDLKILIEEILTTMQLQIEKQNALVSLQAEDGNYMLEADRMHITSVLYNLLDNALKYKRESPVIEIILKTHAMHIELKVKDNGIGIPPAYRLRIFEKLFRVPSDSVHNIKGYGLGLSYVKYIIQRHQGFIEVDSELGKGSVFTVHIPYKEMDEIWFDDKRRMIKKTFRLSLKKQV